MNLSNFTTEQLKYELQRREQKSKYTVYEVRNPNFSGDERINKFKECATKEQAEAKAREFDSRLAPVPAWHYIVLPSFVKLDHDFGYDGTKG